ncbi:MAG: ATP-binding cassette domain-containing protein, partial [Clostridium sp.]
SFTIVSGPSGSGKSTLLNIIGLLDKKSSGDINLFDQKNVAPFSKKAELLLRDKIGYLFQNYALVENKTVGYNLKIALENVKGTKAEKERMIRKGLKEVGLEGYEDKNVYKCSGGEQQRIAIARLLLKPCELILADEPTGSLDHGNKMLVVELLKKLHEDGKTIVMVTHDEELMAIGDSQVKL